MTASRVARKAALLSVFAIILLGLVAGPACCRMLQEKVTLLTAAGEKIIDAEIARSNHEKARGLMFRKELADSAGMLFLYGAMQEITMWMKNTYIPLDMVFIRSDGIVHRIEAYTVPHSEEIISSQGPVSAVLELAGGAAARLGLKPGDQVRHGSFAPAPQ